ncbi:hypothetical protein [Streptomyces zhihengii]
MPVSKAQQVEVAERRAKLVKLRRAGINFEDPQILALGYTSRQAASKDFHRTLKKHAAQEAAEVAVYRQESKERLLALLAAVWPDAVAPEPDLKAHEQARKIVSDLDELLGTKMPVRAEISGPDGGDIPFSGGELSELIALISISDRADAAVPVFDHDTDEDDEEDDLDQDDDDDSDD